MGPTYPNIVRMVCVCVCMCMCVCARTRTRTRTHSATEYIHSYQQSLFHMYYVAKGNVPRPGWFLSLCEGW